MKLFKEHPILYLILGLILFIVPIAIYLGFLIPAMKDEYIALMASGGALGGAGMLGSTFISDKTRTGSIFKTASKSFTLLVVVTLVQEFLNQLLGLAAVGIVGMILFLILKGKYKDAKRRKEDTELATKVAGSVAQAIK